MGKIFQEHAGFKDILMDPTLHGVTAPNGKTVVAIIGSGYHVVNGFKPTPPGVAKDGGIIDATVTLQQVIDGVMRATFVNIRKNPVDTKAKKMSASRRRVAMLEGRWRTKDHFEKNRDPFGV